MRASTGRAIRIEQMKKTIVTASSVGEAVDEQRFIAELALEFNLSVRKIKEYLSLLIDIEFCVRTEKGIFTKLAAENLSECNRQHILESKSKEELQWMVNHKSHLN